LNSPKTLAEVHHRSIHTQPQWSRWKCNCSHADYGYGHKTWSHVLFALF